jgi:hypothetical protein
MHLKFPFNDTKPIVGEASVDIDKPLSEVFGFVGERFFENYPKWATEVVEFEPLDGKEVVVGAKARQVRKDNDSEIESVFTIIDFERCSKLIFQGLNEPYKHSYLLDNAEPKKMTRLTFRFELLELEVFMRPFEKLIRYAIEDGAETTVENIKELLVVESN